MKKTEIAKLMTKKHWLKYLLGLGALVIVGGAVAGGVVSCSNGSATSNSKTTNTQQAKPTTPTTTNKYVLEKGVSQSGLQYTSNAVNKTISMVATSTPINNQPGDLDIYAGGGLSAIITPSEIASGETIHLTLNLASGVNAPTYKDLMSLPSLIAIQPYQSSSTYTITQGKTLNMTLNANSSFNVNFKALPSDWWNQPDGSDDTTIETNQGQFGIYLVANNSTSNPIEFWTGLYNDFPSVLYDNIPNQWMASADLTIEINGKSVPIDLSASLQSYFTKEKASGPNDFVNLTYENGKLNGASVNIGNRLTTWFWTDVNNTNTIMKLGSKPGWHTVSPFTIITQTPGTSNQFTILWNVTAVQII